MRPHIRGFTVFELLAVLALLLLLSGIIAPLVSTEIADSKRNEAMAGVHRIAVSVGRYLTDTLSAPTVMLTGGKAQCLQSSGREPDGVPYPTAVRAPLDAALMADPGTQGWAGPYLDEPSPADPWGRKFLVYVRGFEDRRHNAWVISAGPDGVIETAPEDLSTGGDDVGIVIR